MSVGLVVEKCGMSRIFSEDGGSVPVTILKVSPTYITQLKTVETDGYSAIQVTTGAKKPNKLNKPALGHYKKASVKPGMALWEFRLSSDEEVAKYKVGDELKIEDVVAEGIKIDVRGKSKGKGFAGCIKRHNFSMQDATHGNSLSHRAPGSIGQNQTPGRVFKGKKMSGQMGNVRTTVQNQPVVKIDSENNLVMVKGTVPGAPGGFVVIFPSVKTPSKGAK